ncbi:unnamed protein product [Phytophthora lilii]|uniref:Unnamed protein product n=1 Tax=Phytophthora lilii TaxID=2077276 RepID=A0A9W6WPS3_9STRA|nr:unnamed protein product [Phytophthora lilii]
MVLLRVGLAFALTAVAFISTGNVDAASSTSSSTSVDCPSACPEVYQPVCGSDGVTYSSKCFLRLAACNSNSNSEITVASDGECMETTSNGNSASSDCSEVCTRIYKPVCGSDGVTYSNDCVFGVAQCKSGGAITPVSDGECEASSASSTSSGGACPDACIDIYDPVTDENGVEYSNECYLQMAKCKNKRARGLAASVDTKSGSSSCDNRVCTMDYSPVCGSDGVSYSNFCMLSLAHCKNSTIVQVSDGECSEPAQMRL